MNTWLLIFLCGLITFFIRFIPLSGLLNFKGSKTYLRIIEIIPIVVLTPIIFQAIFIVSENDISILINPKFYAALVGVIISFYFKNVIYEKYLKTNCLITYGSHLSSKGVQGKKYPWFIRNFNLYRKYFWYASHLRTFRHDLWLSMNPNDLLDKNGQYFPVAWDLAIMFPMLEMAGKRQEFMQDLLYVYNDQNPISDHKIRRKEQILVAKEIRRKKIYKEKKFI